MAQTKVFDKGKRNRLRAVALMRKKRAQGYKCFIDSNPGGYIVVWRK